MKYIYGERDQYTSNANKTSQVNWNFHWGSCNSLQLCVNFHLERFTHTDAVIDISLIFFLSDFVQVISFCSCSTRQTMNLARCRNSWEHKFINPEFYLEFCVFLLSTAAMPHLVNCIGLTTTTIHTHTHREGASERESEERKWVSSISARLNCQSLQVTPSRQQSGHNFPGKLDAIAKLSILLYHRYMHNTQVSA